MKRKGFTLVELTFVAGIVASLSVGVYQMVARGKRAQCINNLKQIYQAITMFTMDYNTLPDAKFFPSSPSDPKGIQNILKPYGARGQIFFCPSIPDQLNKYGTNYIWNDNLSGKNVSSPDKWLMTEMTAVSKKVPPPHNPYFCILYADGHVKPGPRVNFPDVERNVEQQKPQKPQPSTFQPQRETFKPVAILTPLKKKIVAGESTEIKFFLTDPSGNKVNLKGKKIKIKTDCKKDVFTESFIVNEDTQESSFTITFAKSGKRNIFIEEEASKIKGGISVEVLPGKTERFIFENIPSEVVAGKQIEVNIYSSDKYGNKTSYSGEILLSDLTGDIEKKIKLEKGEWEGKVIFKKAVPSNILIGGNDNLISKSPPFKVLPSEKIELTAEVKANIIAGEKFNLYLKVIDEFGNIKNDFTGKIKISTDNNNEGNFPEEVEFNEENKGIKKIEFTLYKSGERKITFSSEKLKLTKKIFVSSGPLSYYEIENIRDQIAGKPFTIFVKGKDKWGNRIGSFYIQDKNNSLKKVESDFSAGMWIEKVVITKAGENQIIVDDRNGHTGKSNIFDVKPEKVEKVELKNLPLTVSLNKEYEVEVSLKDKFENIVEENLSDYKISFSKKCEYKITGEKFPVKMNIKFNETGICEIRISKDGKILKKFNVFVFPEGEENENRSGK